MDHPGQRLPGGLLDDSLQVTRPRPAPDFQPDALHEEIKVIQALLVGGQKRQVEDAKVALQHNIGLDFATGVRTVLRQDPDIIMVGEIRDEETAECAVQAALTGHLVLTTLHTNDAASTVTRFLDLGIAPYLLKSALLGVVAQRLVRTLCRYCKRPAKINEDEWRLLTEGATLPRPKQIYRTVGCDECRHTGYRGRLGIYEIMLIDEVLRERITRATDATALQQHALETGMVPLCVSGALKVSAGLTTPEEVLRVIQGKPEFKPEGQQSADGAYDKAAQQRQADE